MAPVSAAGGAARDPTPWPCDVGGTTSRARSSTRTGRSQLTQTPDPARGGGRGRRRPAGVGELVAGPARVAGRRARRAGDVDAEAGIARYSVNLGWRDLPLRAFAAGILDVDIPLVLDHDVRAPRRAEATVGATRGVAEPCLIVIGTGIAAVLIAGGVVVRASRRMPGSWATSSCTRAANSAPAASAAAWRPTDRPVRSPGGTRRRPACPPTQRWWRRVIRPGSAAGVARGDRRSCARVHAVTCSTSRLYRARRRAGRGR